MNRRIIALLGKGGIGKSTTLNLLPDRLSELGWIEHSRINHGNGIDFISVFELSGIRLGVSTAGDNYREVSSGMRILIKASCIMAISACRSFDKVNPKTGIKKGTHEALKEFSNDITFVRKTIESNEANREIVNLIDITRIVELI